MLLHIKTATRLLHKAWDHAATSWMHELNAITEEANTDRVHYANEQQMQRLSEIWRLSGIPEEKFTKQMQRLWALKNKGQQLIMGKLS